MARVVLDDAYVRRVLGDNATLIDNYHSIYRRMHYDFHRECERLTAAGIVFDTNAVWQQFETVARNDIKCLLKDLDAFPAYYRLDKIQLSVDHRRNYMRFVNYDNVMRIYRILGDYKQMVRTLYPADCERMIAEREQHELTMLRLRDELEQARRMLEVVHERFMVTG